MTTKSLTNTLDLENTTLLKENFSHRWIWVLKKLLTFSYLGFNLLGERTKINSLKKPVALRHLPGSSNIVVQSLVPVGHWAVLLRVSKDKDRVVSFCLFGFLLKKKSILCVKHWKRKINVKHLKNTVPHFCPIVSFSSQKHMNSLQAARILC